jgi:tRNA 5-methylaminomethyl-2-thiouridine biosynthesis bifunctional protein
VLHLADDLGAMNALLERQGLPGDYVQACSAVEAGARAGVPCARPAWWFAGGGWIEPASFVRHALSAARAGSGVALRAGCRVASVEPRGARWLAFSARGELLGEADVIVLANAADAARLVPAPVALGWRLERSRGQVTRVPASTLAAWGQRAPWVPLAHHGYAIPLPDGSVLAGATQAPASDAGHADDAGDSREESAEAEEIEEGSVPRREDDLHNLEVFARLTGQALAAPWPAVLDSRVGYRCHSDDRLPVVGAVAALAGNGRTMRASELAQPRRVPRQSGLYVLTALGARGIASATLGAQVLAAWVAGSPMPIDTDLLDAVDAARHVSREARRRGANAADDG